MLMSPSEVAVALNCIEAPHNPAKQGYNLQLSKMGATKMGRREKHCCEVRETDITANQPLH